MNFLSVARARFIHNLRRILNRLPLVSNSAPVSPVDVQNGENQVQRQPAKVLSQRARGQAGRPSRARRVWMTAGVGALCALLPSALFYVVSYRQNLGVAREKFPPAPAFSPGERILILAPHCDDETLGAGGAIAQARARGLRVRVVFLTNGDGSRSTQIASGVRHLRRDSMRQLAAMRQKETVAALAELGVGPQDIVFLGYPDGGTQAMWQTNWNAQTLFRSPFTKANRSPYSNSRTPHALYCGQSALNDVIGAMRDFRPTLILTTHPADTHPDHWAAYAYARAALESLRLDATPHMSTHARAQAAWAQNALLLTFLVHHGAWPTPHGYHPDAVLTPPAALLHLDTQWMQSALDESSQAAKTRALSRYASQLATTPQFLRGFLRRNELFGEIPIHLPGASFSKPSHQQAGSKSSFANAANTDDAVVEANAGSAKTSERETSDAKTSDAGKPNDSPSALVRIVEDATGESPVRDVWPAADLENISWRPTPDAGTFKLRISWRSSRRWPSPRPQSSRWSASRGLLYRVSLHAFQSPNAKPNVKLNANAKNAEVKRPGARGSTTTQKVTRHNAAMQIAANRDGVGVCEIEARSSPQPRALLRFRDATGSPSGALRLKVRRVSNGLEIDVPRHALTANASTANASKPDVKPAVDPTRPISERNETEGEERRSMSLLISASTFLGTSRLDQTPTGTLRFPVSVDVAKTFVP